MLLVASRREAGPIAAVRAIRALRPDLHAVTNEELVARFQQVGFSYFRQISAVLTHVTLSFGLLLITVLLTVSVNQRLGEIAALRALGFSRARVVADVLARVGAGRRRAAACCRCRSACALALARHDPARDAGDSGDLHFFVFEPRALVLHGAAAGR